MYCTMCSENTPCTDCPLDKVKNGNKKIFHTQGGGTVEYCKEVDWYIFVEPPPWGKWKVGALMPKEWGIV